MKILKVITPLHKNFIGLVIILISSSLVTGQSIIVNSTNYKQTIDMMGGDMERSSKAIQSAQNKDDILNWSFGDIDFNVCRVQYDKNQELVEGTKNWAFYDKQVATMKAIKGINPDIKFFATMRSDYDGYGDDNNMPDWIQNYSTKATNIDKYGIFLADYCEYMSDNGVPISFISTAKEWMWHVRAEEADDIINKLNSELDDRGIDRPVISDQGFWSISQGITYLNKVEDIGTKGLYHSFCSHNYDNESPEKWVEIIEKSVALGKPMYDDETSTGSGSPTSGVEREMFKQIDEYIKKAQRYEAGLSGEIYFEIWSRGIDKETRSIYFPANGTGTRLRGYYMMKQFANNILDSRYVTSSALSLQSVYTISFRKDDKMVLWVINESTTDYGQVPIIIDGAKVTSSIATTYWTNDTPISGSNISYTGSGNVFNAAVAGESMSCYIFDVTDDENSIFCIEAVTQPANLEEGISYSYYEGTWDLIPDFGTISSVKSGFLPSINLSAAEIADNYGFAFNGYINIETEGEHIFYTTSDDGSKLYVDDFLVVDNDGLHGAEEASGNLCLEEGYHEIRVEYFEGTGGNSLSVMYEGPDFSKTNISDLYYNNVLNLALDGIASQSSTDYGGLPERAIDNNTDGDFNNNSVTHTSHGDAVKWWQVDLGGEKTIEEIVIFNRVPYSDRLNNYTVEVIDSNGAVTFSEFFESYPDPSVTVATGLVIGKTVKISKNSDLGLTLAEVQVFGGDFIKQNQSITFNALPTKQVGDPDFSPDASASSGLAITYSSSNTDVATIIDDNIHIVGAGTSIIGASQDGDTNYNGAEASQTLTVTKATQEIVFETLPTKVVGDADFTPGATASSGLPVSYTSSDTGVATIVDGDIHIIASGVSNIIASQAGDDTYASALEITQVLTVTPETMLTTSDDLVGILIHPNPVESVLKVEFIEDSYKDFVIYNINGKVVGQGYIQKKNELNIDFSNLSKGIYLLNLSGDQITKIFRVVKK